MAIQGTGYRAKTQNAIQGAMLTAGPYDLSKFMNVQFGGEEHEAAIAKVLKAAHAANKTAAIFCECLSVP